MKFRAKFILRKIDQIYKDFHLSYILRGFSTHRQVCLHLSVSQSPNTELRVSRHCGSYGIMDQFGFMAIIRDYPLSAKSEPSHSTKMSTERREEEDRQLILVGWSALFPLQPMGSMRTLVSTPSNGFDHFVFRPICPLCPPSGE